MDKLRSVGLLLVASTALVLASSCSKTKPLIAPLLRRNPETTITFAPVQYDTTAFRVHFYWNGSDKDGQVVRFHLAVDDDSLMPLTEWPATAATDTTLMFLVDPIQELKVHTFKVAAEDNDGQLDLTPASRTFSAKTLPPQSQINRGPDAFNPVVGPNFTFGWSGIDPDGSETGGPSPVDSFQYMLLRVGGVADTTSPHDPLPRYNQDLYTALIRSAVGEGLPAGDPAGHTRWDDWKWIGIRALEKRFRDVKPGEYVFAVRAVDIAGAREKDLAFVRNIRHFSVTNKDGVGPLLIVRNNFATGPTAGVGPGVDTNRLDIFEGETVSFSWTASAEAYGGEIVGYTYVLDDSTSFPALDPRSLGVTLQPGQLTVGSHFLYVRAVDDGGLATTVGQSMLIVHPDFKDLGTPRSILFVDDAALRLGNGSAPTDRTETDWWMLGSGGTGPLLSLGVPYMEWDTIEQSNGGVAGRKQPGLRDLAPFSTVVWATDPENGGSVATAFFKTVAGRYYSDLQAYLRAGGTLIVTGWHIASDASGNRLLTQKVATYSPNGICAAFAVGSVEYGQTVFPRMYMGIDNSLQNQTGRRTFGASDFVQGAPTSAGFAMGFDTARVDTGNYSYGVQYPDQSGPSFKWNTNSYPPPITPDLGLFPGLAGIEGWIMASDFGCVPTGTIGLENPALPVVQPIYTYHGVPRGVLQDGAPSPREGLVCGSFAQSHDLGTNGGVYERTAAIGRIAFFTFPLYYLKDADAINIMRKSYEYVSASPTLP
jgi:hypothetical protein